MGLEAMPSPVVSNGNPQLCAAGAAKASVAVSPPISADADLRSVIETWPALAEPIKAAILALISLAKGAKR